MRRRRPRQRWSFAACWLRRFADVDERIEGDGITLRRWRAEDVDVLREIAASSLDYIARFMGSAASELADPEAFVTLAAQYWDDGRVFAYAVERDNEVVGHITYAPDGDVGYWVRVEATGSGVATAAAGTLTNHVFAKTPNSVIASACNAANTASRRVLEKSGFRLTGERTWTPRNEHEGDTELVFELTRPS